MAKIQPNPSETASCNANDLSALKAIFAQDGILMDEERQRSFDRFNQRNAIVAYIADAYIEMLGKSTEFDIGLCDPEPLGDGLFHRDIIVTCKGDFKLFADDELVHKLARALVEINLSSSQIESILTDVIERIESSCTLTYQFVNDRLHILTDGILPIEITENDVVYPPGEQRPLEVVLALANLRSVATMLATDRLKEELESLTLPDQLIEVRDRLPDTAFRPGYRKVLELVEKDLARKVELEQQRKLLHESIQGQRDRNADAKGTSAESDSIYHLLTVETEKKLRDLEAKANAIQKEIDEKIEEDALARGLTTRRLMYLLENEMPIFKDATNNRVRGELAYMLTGLGGVTKDGKKGETIRQDYSSYRRLITDEDKEWLEGWKAKLKKVPRNKGGTL